MRHTRLALSLMLTLPLVAGCDALAGLVGSKGGSALVAGSNLAQPNAIGGTVLGVDGAPAPNVLVRAYMVSNNAGGLISNNAGGLVSNNSGAYRTQAANLETRTDATGHFQLTSSDPATPLNVEAVLSDNLKAIQLKQSTGTNSLRLQLAPTGRIRGRVRSDSAAVTDLLGIDVFIPGTGYVAKTNHDGSFDLPFIPVGTFPIYATHPDLGRGSQDGVAVSSNATTAMPDLVISTLVPQVTSLSSPNAGPGQTITVSGTNFGVSLGKHPAVLIGGLDAPVASASDTALSITVPAAAQSGPLVVRLGGITSNAQTLQVLQQLALFPDAQASAALDPNAAAATSDVIAVGLPRRYALRAKDTAGALVPNPNVSWTSTLPGSSVASDGTFLARSVMTRFTTLAASAGALRAQLSVEVVDPIRQVILSASPAGPLVAVPLGATPSAVASSLSLFAQTVFANAAAPRNLPVVWGTQDARILLTPDGTVTVKPGVNAGPAVVSARSVADPSQSATLSIPIVHQGSLDLVIQ